MNENIKAKNKVKSCIFTFPHIGEVDVTKYVNIPIVYNPVLDETLDTAQIVLSGMRQKDFENLDVTTAFEPCVRADIIFENESGDGQEHTIHMMISSDVCKLQRKDDTKYRSYKHTIQLVELTKELERLSVDTLNFTNPIPREYDSEAYASWTVV